MFVFLFLINCHSQNTLGSTVICILRSFHIHIDRLHTHSCPFAPAYTSTDSLGEAFYGCAMTSCKYEPPGPK